MGDPQAASTFECLDCSLIQNKSEAYDPDVKESEPAKSKESDPDVQTSTGSTTRVRLRQKISKLDRVRCNGCHNLRTRTNRIVGRLQLKKDYGAMGKDTRSLFMQEGRELYGDGMAKVLQEHIIQTRAQAGKSDSSKKLQRQAGY